MSLAACHSGGGNGGSGGSTGGGGGVTNGTPVTGSTGADAEQPNQTVSLSGPMTRYIGRVNPSTGGGALMAWSGTGAQVTFVGSQLTIGMTQTQPTQADWVDVYIDNNAPYAFVIDDTNTLYPIPVPGGSGTHTATIVKRTGAESGEILFQGVKTDGFINPNTAAAPARLIEFIGDDVTVGYGVDGPQGNPNACPFPGQYPTNPNYTNIDDAYPVGTAKQLQAEWSVIGWSSKGVYVNMDGSMGQTLPILWTMQDPQDANAVWGYAPQPNVVVITAGATDVLYWASNSNVAVDATDFTSTYVGFLTSVRTAYPQAQIIVALSPMLSKYTCMGGGTSTNGNCATAAGVATQSTYTLGQSLLKGAISAYQSAKSDSKVTYFEFTTDATNVSCDYSPDIIGQQELTSQLVTEIKSVMKW